MKTTRRFALWPMNSGLDLSSTPGTQKPISLRRASNIVLSTRNSCRKKPGFIKIPAVGDNDGVQNAIQIFGTYGNAKVSELVRFRKGRFEVLRDVDNADPEFVDVRIDNGDGTFSDVGANPTDKVTFLQFANALIIGIENHAPLYYVVRGNLHPLQVRPSHILNPPSFFGKLDYRLAYGGIGTDQDRLFVSAVDSIQDYTLLSGGFGLRFDDGDNDPIGLTGMSEPFRGRHYVTKWNHIYEMMQSSYGYSLNMVTDEVGAVSNTCICTTQRDVFFVDPNGIHSLSTIQAYGADERFTLTWPIYEYFQENVNWDAYKNFYLTYDKPTATLLFAYTSIQSSTNDKLFGMNLETKEFFEQDGKFQAIGKYIYRGRQRTFVHDADNGAGILDSKTYTFGQKPINVDIMTGPIFPLGEVKAQFTLTEAWLLLRPTTKSVKVNIDYSIDGGPPNTEVVDSYGDGYGSLISDVLGGFIGQENIGKMPLDMAIRPFKFTGQGNSLQFRVYQEPTSEDISQPFELYGLIYEIETTEDSVKDVTL